MYVERTIEKSIRKYIARREIVAVIGPRQVGKTTLIENIVKDFDNVNKITLDDVEARTLMDNNMKAFVEKYVKGYDYLFIDEIQYSERSGDVLKYIYDTEKVKVFISGSSASEISIKSLQKLVGRVFIYYLFPFSFEEYLSYKDKRALNILKQGNTLGLDSLDVYFKEFAIYGGYPEVVLARDKEEKELVLKNIYNTYFLKEIRNVLGITEDNKVVKVLKALALQLGGEVNYEEIASMVFAKNYEVKEYLEILEKTFIVSKAVNYHREKRKELKKTPKVYFVDNGLRNMVVGNFSYERQDISKLYENFVASEIVKKGFELKYWRTKSGAEIDFVLEKGEVLIPVEVKTRLSSKSLSKGFVSFLKDYNPSKSFVLSENLDDFRTIGEESVYFKKLVDVVNILEFSYLSLRSSSESKGFYI